MVIVVAVAARRGDAGEIEGTRNAAGRSVRCERRHRLDHAWRIALILDADDAAEGRDIDRGLGEGREHGAYDGGFDGRQIALHIDDDVVAPLGIETPHRLMHAVGAGRQVGIGEDGAATGALDRGGDLGLGAGDDDRTDRRLDGAPPDMDDHRLAMDVGERLVGQPGRPEAGGNHEQRIARQRHRGHRSDYATYCREMRR